MRPILTILCLTTTATAAEPGQHYAVLVGVREYEHSKLPPLKYTENDVTDLAAVLKQSGYEITLLTDSAAEDSGCKPTRKNILANLDTVLRKCKRHDTVLIGFAGHGLQFEGGDDSYFCPIDARPFVEGADTLVSLKDVYDRLDRCGADVKLMLVDACRDDPSRPRGAARGIDGDSAPVPTGRGIGVLFSCSESERAFEHEDLKHGVFFHFVIEGLKGEAKDAEGAVTWDSLRAYVKRNVARRVPELIGGVARQRPTAVGSIIDEPVLLISLTADFEAINALILSGKGSEEYIRREAPRKLALWREAAQRGASGGQYLYGRCFELGIGEEQNPVKAVEWIRKATDQDMAMAQCLLGWYFRHGIGVEKNDAEAIKWYRKAAVQGYSSAQKNLGICYYYGIGTPVNSAEALEWFRKAADQGDAGAQYGVGVYYRDNAVEKDYAEAVRWDRKAADQGYAPSQYNLGFSYERGFGVDQDLAAAVKWYRKAADQGHAEAQCKVGICYTNGSGVDQDHAVAVKWFHKAADQGDAIAQSWLGFCYSNGSGVEKDDVEAVKWYRKAADQGDATAQYNLGLCYHYGLGVERDVAIAEQWYRKAANNGHEDAKARLKELDGK